MRLCFRASGLLSLAVCTPAQVLTSQYDNARTGANVHETVLTPENVNTRQFGKLYSFPVDGDVYAQPLFMPNIEIAGKGKHNVVFVATEHDSVYAFDGNTVITEPLWHVNFLDSARGIGTVPSTDVNCPFILPEVGITSTPVIDTQSGTIYVLARTRERQGGTTSYVQKVHTLSIVDGTEKSGGPWKSMARSAPKVIGSAATLSSTLYERTSGPRCC